MNDLNRNETKKAIIIKKGRASSLISKSVRLNNRAKLNLHNSVNMTPVRFSQENDQMQMIFGHSQSIESKKKTSQATLHKTSRTISANMLRWSLSRSIKLGIFSRKLFTKEIIKISSRKSTIDQKQILLIKPDSEDFLVMKLNDSRRSRSSTNLLNEDSDEN